MAIDGYQDGAPTASISSPGAAEPYGPTAFKLTGTNLTAWAEVSIVHVSDTDYANRQTIDFELGSSFTQQKTEQFLKFPQQQSYYSGDTMTYKNPLTYTRQSVPHIIEGVAGTHLGLTLDTSAFSTAHTQFSSDLRSAQFFRKTCLEIFKALCEQTAQIFIYINNSQELSIDWLDNDPSGSADYTLTESNINYYRRFYRIRDREFPSAIEWGWDPWDCKATEPEKLEWKRDIDPPALTNPPIGDPYRAEYVDDHDDDYGTYKAWDDFLYLELNVNHIGFIFDINDRIKIVSSVLGLNANHVFRVHEITMNPENMTCDLVLLSGRGWNPPI